MADVPEKILIDTNIKINLEDNKEIEGNYSDLNRICGENGIQILIHESSYEDILQDKDETRKKSLYQSWRNIQELTGHNVAKLRKRLISGLLNPEMMKSIPIY
jgi:hypothetical protein